MNKIKDINNSEREYQRLAAEVLQNQKFRITLFTFTIIVTASIISFSIKRNDVSSLLISIFAIYTVLIPSVMLINHYTRSVNYISEYLNIFHNEAWMSFFDKLNEDILPANNELSSSHKVMHILGAFSTDRIFNFAYIILNTFIFFYGILRIEKLENFYYGILISLYLFTFIIMWVFRPITKSEYRKLWSKTKENT